jgi:hypothetical protein
MYDYNLYESGSVSALESAERANEQRAQILEQQIKKETQQRKLEAFVNESKEFLVVEFMNFLLEKCIPDRATSEQRNYGRMIVESFVQEEGADNLLDRFRTKTLFLSEAATTIDSHHRQIIHGSEVSGLAHADNSEIKQFYSDLDGMDYDAMCKAIVDRVTKAEGDFVTANVKDKELIEDMAEKTQEKIDKVKGKTEEDENEMKMEHVAIYNQKLNDLSNRSRNILESIVKHTALHIVSDDSIRESYTKADGKLDTQKIIEMSEIMYTFLEMVNTTRIKDVNANYINEAIQSIK